MEKKKRNYNQLREVAFTLFMQDSKQKEISKKLGVSEITISRWAKDDNWDRLKKGMLTSKHKRISELYDELAEFNKMIKDREIGSRFPNSKEADVRRKLIRDIADLEKKYNIGQTSVIARDFVLFTKDIDFAFSQKANEYFELFINHLIEKQKWQEQ
ncbi:MAG: hypothetical protein LBT56_00095 [Prevotellaceae bacterium]|jgi:transposase|nr:hypothetical protein [Prevotellaceae bacterium]